MAENTEQHVNIKSLRKPEDGEWDADSRKPGTSF
jgi:hypothetical protein